MSDARKWVYGNVASLPVEHIPFHTGEIGMQVIGAPVRDEGNVVTVSHEDLVTAVSNYLEKEEILGDGSDVMRVYQDDGGLVFAEVGSQYTSFEIELTDALMEKVLKGATSQFSHVVKVRQACELHVWVDDAPEDAAEKRPLKDAGVAHHPFSRAAVAKYLIHKSKEIPPESLIAHVYLGQMGNVLVKHYVNDPALYSFTEMTADEYDEALRLFRIYFDRMGESYEDVLKEVESE